jgi:DNA polymerase (family 10)
LREIGERLRMAGAPRFRARAFTRGAQALESAAADLGALAREGRLRELPGIGPGLARVIGELQATGRSTLLDGLRSEMPPGSLELSRLRSMSPARIRRLHEALGVESLDALEAACLASRVRTVRGFGPATEARILEEIRARRGPALLLHEALDVAESLAAHLERSPGVSRADMAGELRRRHERVSAIQVVATGPTAEASVAALAAFPRAERVVASDGEGATGVLAGGTSVRLDWAPPSAYGSALVRRTGSEAHWRRLDRLARDLDSLSPPELGSVEAADERSFYARLGLPCIPPELREDEGEVEAALAGELPSDLVRREDVRGMVHCHTRASDGRDTIVEMARAAEAAGYQYLTITDHSRSAAYAGGLSVERLLRQWDEIESAQELTGVRLLRGTECDILRDGSLDYPDEVLSRLDVVVASVHQRHGLDEDAMTRRVERALRHPAFKIWGHSRGRLLGRRPPFACRMEELLDAAASSRVAIEINGDPRRLDMDPHWARRAGARGVPFVLSVDAHSTADLENLRYAVDMARRAGLRASQVLNTLPVAAFARAVRPI